MKILIVSRGYPSKKEPHRGCFEKDQAEALKALGHDVKVISLDLRFRFIWRKIGIFEKKINSINYYDFFLIPGIIIKLIGGRNLYRKLRKFMILRLAKKVISPSWIPDVIYSHFYWNTFEAVHVKNKYHIPLVGIEHASDIVQPNLNRDITNICKEAYSNTNQLISVSYFLKERINNIFNINSLVVPNMLGKEFIESNYTNNTQGIKRFVSIGTLIERKGYAELIKAFSKSNLPKKSWHLNIIGYGPLHKSLQKLIVQLNLHENITLLGAKTKEEIIKILSDSDIFVLASKLETFGVVYIEALSLGLPCIATNCGGSTGIIDATNGISIPVNDETALIEGIEYMAENYNNYNKSAIRNNCLQKYSPQNIAKQLESIFIQTINNTQRIPSEI